MWFPATSSHDSGVETRSTTSGDHPSPRRRRVQMKTQNIPGSHQQSSRGAAINLLLLTPLFLILSLSNAVGQGLKMTQLNPPGYQTGTAIPYGVNASEAVVGFGTATSGATVGFLYSGGKYTTLDFPA